MAASDVAAKPRGQHGGRSPSLPLAMQGVALAVGPRGEEGARPHHRLAPAVGLQEVENTAEERQ